MKKRQAGESVDGRVFHHSHVGNNELPKTRFHSSFMSFDHNFSGVLIFKSLQGLDSYSPFFEKDGEVFVLFDDIEEGIGAGRNTGVIGEFKAESREWSDPKKARGLGFISLLQIKQSRFLTKFFVLGLTLKLNHLAFTPSI